MSEQATSEGTWRDLPQARPLRAWRDRDLAAVARHVHEMLQPWAADWGVPWPTDAGVRCTAGSIAIGVGWDCIGAREGASAWLRWSGEEAAVFARAWFDADHETPVVRSVLDGCRSDAGLRLATALHLAVGRSCSSANPHARLWSGDVLATLPWGAQLLLEAGLVEPLLKRRGDLKPATGRPAAPPLVQVRDALADTELALRVELAPCELGLGALQALQVDDVLRLQHGVDQSATVIDAGGRILFRAWLAQRRGRCAVELAPLAAE